MALETNNQIDRETMIGQMSVEDKPLIVYVVNVGWYFRLHWLDRMLAVQKSGFSVAVITCWEDLDGGVLHNLEKSGIRCFHVPFTRRGISIWQEISAYRALYSVLRSLRPSLVHNVTIKPNIYGGIVARQLRIPSISSVTGLGVVFSSRDVKLKLLRSAVLAVYRWVSRPSTSRVLFENRDDLALFVAKRVVPLHKTVKVSGAGVNMSCFQPGPEPSSGTVTVLFAARLLREKGLPELVESIRELRARGCKVIAQVAGIFDDAASDAISENEILGWQREGLVDWLGQRSDMQSVIRNSHIVCLPTTYGEGIPRILIEGAACGRPLVATDTPGCNEIIEDGVNGFLVRPELGRGLSERLETLVGDKLLRARMGQAGRAKVVDGYSEQAVVASMLAVYDEARNSS